jgi:hypothetical protein
MRNTYPTHIMLLDSITSVIFGEEQVFGLWISHFKEILPNFLLLIVS